MGMCWFLLLPQILIHSCRNLEESMGLSQFPEDLSEKQGCLTGTKSQDWLIKPQFRQLFNVEILN